MIPALVVTFGILSATLVVSLGVYVGRGRAARRDQYLRIDTAERRVDTGLDENGIPYL